MGVFLIILGGLLLASFMGVSGIDAIRSLSLVVVLFGVWLAIVSAIMPTPPVTYAATRFMFLGWGGLVTGFGALWLSAYYGLTLLAIVFATMLIVGGIGSLGYSLARGQAKKSPPSVR